MANERRGNRLFNFIKDNTVPVVVVWCAFAILIPMPQFLVDIGMIINLAFSIIILLVVVTTPRASDFETFPRLIVLQTMFGLGINISSTKLILAGKVVGRQLQGQSFMVQAFANLIAGNDIIIGIIIFVVIILAQMMVFTKGATRVAEVAARFALDSMNNKMFDINDRLNSGAITPEQAEALKNSVRKEIDFYSAMDGSSKFVSGNVKLGIAITAINLIGGFIIGMVRNRMPFGNALETYSILTIGDGLTSQVPSIIISAATGILVTGTKSDESLSEQLSSNLTRETGIYEILGAVLILIGVVFFLLNGSKAAFFLIPFGGLSIWAGIRLGNKKTKKEEIKQQEVAASSSKAAADAANDEKIIMLDPLSLELGYALIPLVDKEKGAELLERIVRIRTEARLDMGFDIPKIRIRDNMTLEPDTYSFKIDGIEAGKASIRLGYLMCMDTGGVITPMEGEKTKDPAFGMDAIWVPEDRRSEAEQNGYIVVDPPTIISTHITEIIRSHASQMLDRQAVSEIINKVKENNPVLINEVIDTAKIPYGTIQKVFQNLLDEKVSIRNYVRILETMANYASMSQNVWDLTAKVREALGLQICSQYVDPEEKKLRVIKLSQDFTELIGSHAYYPPDGSKPYVAFDPVDRRNWITAVSNSLAKIDRMGFMPVILCVSDIRQLVRSAIEREHPGVVVISDMEMYTATNGNGISVEIIDEISMNEV